MPVHRYRAAIIGTGRIASLLERDPLRDKPHTHAAHYRAHPRTTLVAGSDIAPDRLTAFGADWGIVPDHLYADYVTMLARERPEIVSVCAYAPDRLDMCRAALEAGARGLWIEKAVACSLDDARAIQRLLRDAGAAAIVDHPRRAETRYRTVARWIREETLGRLESVHVIFSGQVIHTGTHAWDVLLDWCGPWTSVTASLDDDTANGDGRVGEPADLAGWERLDVEDRGARARISFASGVEAFVSAGAKDYFVFQFDLVFACGRVRIGNDVWEVLTPRASPRYEGFMELDATSPDAALSNVDAYQTPMLADLVLALDEGHARLLSGAAATAALALGVAVLQAGLSGERVGPDDIDTALRIATV
jgi:predicted dehydrogenase